MLPVFGQQLKLLVLLLFVAVGCANPSVSSGMVLRRRGRYAIVRCNITRNFWRLHCLDSKWDGYLGNCTTWNPTPDPIKEEWNVGKLLHLNSFPFSKYTRPAIRHTVRIYNNSYR